ncbi:hypothetical protein EDB89DRAFT_1998238, partial [Lactarius sanguifluus]
MVVRTGVGFLSATWLLPFDRGSSGAGGGPGEGRGGGMTLRCGGKGAVGRLGNFRTSYLASYTAPTAVANTCNERRHGSAKPRNRANILMDDAVPNCDYVFIRTHCTGPLSTIGIYAPIHPPQAMKMSPPRDLLKSACKPDQTRNRSL